METPRQSLEERFDGILLLEGRSDISNDDIIRVIKSINSIPSYFRGADGTIDVGSADAFRKRCKISDNIVACSATLASCPDALLNNILNGGGYKGDPKHRMVMGAISKIKDWLRARPPRAVIDHPKAFPESDERKPPAKSLSRLVRESVRKTLQCESAPVEKKKTNVARRKPKKFGRTNHETFESKILALSALSRQSEGFDEFLLQDGRKPTLDKIIRQLETNGVKVERELGVEQILSSTYFSHDVRSSGVYRPDMKSWVLVLQAASIRRKISVTFSVTKNLETGRFVVSASFNLLR